jgi:glycosyltransferase involved in cell wall biosynthesis
MLISVIVPCFNQKDTIPALLTSLERQGMDFREFEVILSDDGSTDGSLEILRAYQGPLQLVCVSAEHGGRASARNRAILEARGRYVLFLDGDMTADPGLLQAHLAGLKADENTVCLGRILPAPEFRQDLLAWYRIGRGAQKKGTGRSLPPKYFATGNASLSLDLLKRTGLFNEDYSGWGGEDLEMGYRLDALEGWLVFAENAVTFHHNAETLEAYVHKIRQYAGSGLKRLIQNCPAHAEKGYLRFFASENPLVQAALRLVFHRFWYAFIRLLAPRIRLKSLAFLLYDYITYYNVYRALKKEPHA